MNVLLTTPALAWINWNFDPVAFSLLGIEIRWYGVMFALVFALGYAMMIRMMKKEGQKPELADSLLYSVAIATVIGARLGHCFFYEPQYYLAHPLEILFIRDGGLASHGAAIAIPLSLIYVARKYTVSIWYLLDRVVITVALAGFFIRLGNLFNSEIYGIATTLPWGFIFERNQEILPKHPTQLYEGIGYLLVFVGLAAYYLKKQGKPREGMIFGAFLFFLFLVRFFVEFVKEVQEPWELNYSLNMGQFLSIPFIVIGIFVMWGSAKNKLPFARLFTTAKKTKSR